MLPPLISTSNFVSNLALLAGLNWTLSSTVPPTGTIPLTGVTNKPGIGVGFVICSGFRGEGMKKGRKERDKEGKHIRRGRKEGRKKGR